MQLIFLYLLTISFPSKNIGEEILIHAVSFETPRYVKMTDTVFQVGDLIQHTVKKNRTPENSKVRFFSCLLPTPFRKLAASGQQLASNSQ